MFVCCCLVYKFGQKKSTCNASTAHHLCFERHKDLRNDRKYEAQCAPLVMLAQPFAISHMTTAFGARSLLLPACPSSNTADLRPNSSHAIRRGTAAREAKSLATHSTSTKASQRVVRAGANVNRREAIWTTGGVLAAGSCHPLSSQAFQQGVSKGAYSSSTALSHPTTKI